MTQATELQHFITLYQKKNLQKFKALFYHPKNDVIFRKYDRDATLITVLPQNQFFWNILVNANLHAKFGVFITFSLRVRYSPPPRRAKCVGLIGLKRRVNVNYCCFMSFSRPRCPLLKNNSGAKYSEMLLLCTVIACLSSCHWTAKFLCIRGIFR